MKGFFSNSWVISIFSGIFVFFITSLLAFPFKRNQRKQKIEEANQSIINHLRGYVVENGLPKDIIIEAVKASIARRYDVKSSDLLTNEAFCEELIAEVIGNTYISNQNKTTCLKIFEEYLTTNTMENSAPQSIENEENSRHREFFEPLIISVISGLLCAMLTYFCTFFITYEDALNGKDTKIEIVWAIIFIVFAGFICYMLFKGKRKRRK